MFVVDADLISFWLTPWSAPFRAACLWFTAETQPLRGRKPNKIAPRWLRPFFLQRWVGEAVAARLTANPQTSAYRYGRASEPRWEASAGLSAQRGSLRQFSEAALLWSFGVEVERLLRIAQEHPCLVGDANWTVAALGASAQLARIYAELKRRFKAMQARALVREELRCFVEWQEHASGEASEPEMALMLHR
ncbi:MAG TPA: hypothetical protein VH590_02315 [Ktedonobacterales bacterium]|jgi:hypothetical protein